MFNPYFALVAVSAVYALSKERAQRKRFRSRIHWLTGRRPQMEWQPYDRSADARFAEKLLRVYFNRAGAGRGCKAWVIKSAGDRLHVWCFDDPLTAKKKKAAVLAMFNHEEFDREADFQISLESLAKVNEPKNR